MWEVVYETCFIVLYRCIGYRCAKDGRSSSSNPAGRPLFSNPPVIARHAWCSNQLAWSIPNLQRFYRINYRRRYADNDGNMTPPVSSAITMERCQKLLKMHLYKDSTALSSRSWRSSKLTRICRTSVSPRDNDTYRRLGHREPPSRFNLIEFHRSILRNMCAMCCMTDLWWYIVPGNLRLKR